MAVFLDTNVLAYQFDDSVPEKQERARALFVEHAGEAVISTQVMIELHAVLTRKLGRTRHEAARVLEALSLHVVSTGAELVVDAAGTASAHELSIFDALILEAAAQADCEALLTEDLAHGSTLRGVTIVNPFVP